MDTNSGSKHSTRKDERLRKFYLRIAKRHGHHIAITHVANKMITIIWYMLARSFWERFLHYLIDTPNQYLSPLFAVLVPLSPFDVLASILK